MESAGEFECIVCLQKAKQPVLTPCGHLYWQILVSWVCIYQWINQNRHQLTCPGCLSGITLESLIPIYTQQPAYTRPENIPPRPIPERSQPVRNQEYNPFEQAGNPLETRVNAGYGLFPPMAMLLYSCSFSQGEIIDAPLDNVTKNRWVSLIVFLFILLVTFL